MIDLLEFSTPGHIQRTRRNIREVLRAVDLIVELVDSRIPYTGRAFEEEALFSNKPRIIILSKSDLSDEKALKIWLDFYKNNESLSFIQANLKSYESIKKLKSFVFNELKKIRMKFKEKRMMVVGIPNVGKSSLINALIGKKITRTGNEPGITRGIQWVNVGKGLKLLDTPGILYKKVNNPIVFKKLCLVGSIKNFKDTIDEVLEFGIEFLKNRYQDLLMKYLNVDKPNIQYLEVLETIAKKRNFLKEGGELNLERAKFSLMKDLTDGKIGKVTYELPEDVII